MAPLFKGKIMSVDKLEYEEAQMEEGELFELTNNIVDLLGESSSYLSVSALVSALVHELHFLEYDEKKKVSGAIAGLLKALANKDPIAYSKDTIIH